MRKSNRKCHLIKKKMLPTFSLRKNHSWRFGKTPVEIKILLDFLSCTLFALFRCISLYPDSFTVFLRLSLSLPLGSMLLPFVLLSRCPFTHTPLAGVLRLFRLFPLSISSMQNLRKPYSFNRPKLAGYSCVCWMYISYAVWMIIQTNEKKTTTIIIICYSLAHSILHNE